jgi:hypothetical protein
LSYDLQLNCVISFFFRLHLVLHTYAARFDVTGTVALFGFTFYELKQAQSHSCATPVCRPAMGMFRFRIFH